MTADGEEQNNPGRRPGVTQLLADHVAGDPEAMERLMPLVYEELKRLARHQLRGERAGHTLDTTSIVHEAFLQLADGPPGEWRNRAHFYAVASRVMRHVLVDHARRRNAAKRGGGALHVTLGRGRASRPDDTLGILALDQALGELGAMDPRLEQVVECRYFAGMSVAETAEALEVSVRTVERDWTRAKAYLLRALEADEP